MHWFRVTYVLEQNVALGQRRYRKENNITGNEFIKEHLIERGYVDKKYAKNIINVALGRAKL